MAGDNKIVDLQKAKSSAEQAKADALAVPLPVMKLTALFKTMALSNFRKMFDNADDILFERADKAQTSSEQTAYFDAMRDLRLNKKSIEVAFFKTIAQHIQQLDKHLEEQKQTSLVCTDSLSLIGLDDMEVEVAVENMVSKIKANAERQIEHLLIRLQTLYPRLELTPDTMPFSPKGLCRAFADALSNLDMDIRPRLILFKLFERFFADALGEFYATANQHLVKLGILPELTTSRRAGRTPSSPSERRDARSTESRTPPLAGEEAGGSAVSGSEDDMGLMGEQVVASAPHAGRERRTQSGTVSGAVEGISSQNLMRLRQALRQTGLSSEGDANDSTAGGGETQRKFVTPSQLVTELHECQQDVLNSKDHFAIENANELIMRLISLVENRLTARDESVQIAGKEKDVASLVALLFNFVLEDDQMPERVRNLLSTWQVPYLKLALLDDSFFERETHPARHLLNQVAKAMIGWQPKEKGRDLLLEKLERFTERLLREFDTDPQIFDELNREMTAYCEAEKKRAALIAQRLKDAEEGRARTEFARKKVADLLASVMAGKRIPRPLISALENGWSRKLMICWLQNGVNSPQWREAEAFLETLLWSIDPDTAGVEARQRLLKAIPGLMKEWREGLMEVSHDHNEIEQSMVALELCHKEALRRIEQAELWEPETKASDAPSEGQGTSVPCEVVALGNTTNVSAEKPVKEVDAPVAPEAGTVSEEVEPAGSRSHGLWEKRLEQLRLGSWFEHLSEDGKKVRFKLAAAIKLNGRYIFVNRNGVKMAEFDRQQMIDELASGRLMPLDDGQIFDRALESIISGLRR